ncbi:hypothetical protein EDC19_1295 [Natranaerovirga hydrolytica]|uniref:Uncharacterized protein n=1 Tax=Natranaerovirga hydrolytica TaxID=680378 RepID=A0A4R1MKN2_9FIRM|nr:hypothetical protein [Natranaerovirga hydrolytica]TCK93117.1 hypothetical protein EDC19_1295 [Natranaerovirga hydrolytica]
MIEEKDVDKKVKLYELIEKGYQENEKAVKIPQGKDILIKYCHSYYNGQGIKQIDQEIFDRFFLYYLPKIRLNLSKDKVRHMLKDIANVLELIEKNYPCNLTQMYKNSYKSYADDTLRIIDLRKQLMKNTNTPIISWDPLIIDFAYYTQNNKTKKWIPRKEIYEQGYYELIDRFANEYFIFKKPYAPSGVKIRLEKDTAKLLKQNDVLHMRIKRKTFTTTWEIIELKGCYLSQVDKYIKNTNG